MSVGPLDFFFFGGGCRPTRASQEIPVHGVHEACLVFVRRDDRHLLTRLEILFCFVLQRLSKGVTPYPIKPVSRLSGWSSYIHCQLTDGVNQPTGDLFPLGVNSQQ